MAKLGAVVVAWVLASAGLGAVAGVEPAVAGGSTDWKRVDGGASHTCAVTTGGQLFCWGDDGNGKLGSAGGSSATPTLVPGTGWDQVTAGDDHTCATKTNGQLFCWGSNGNGQLGDGNFPTGSASPVEVAGAATNWAQVSAGQVHTCARKMTGRLFCWGNDGSGQLGDGVVGGGVVSAPAQVVGAATNWSEVSVGQLHTCARKTSDRLFCWGDDTNGQVGDGVAGGPDSGTPGEVTGAATNWALVSTGRRHTCARKTNERLFCWGNDANGELGDGTTGTPASDPSPGQVAGGDKNWERVAAGNGYACATKVTGRLFCWGFDGTGGLGDGMAGAASPTPGQVTGIATDWAQVSAAAGGAHTCARKTDRRLFCWGNDANGQLGDGTGGGFSATPAEVATHP